MKNSKKTKRFMAYRLCTYSLYICNPTHSFTTPLMKNDTSTKIQLIKLGIGILVGITMYLLIKIIF